jgi:hypothetical protein
VPIRILHLAGFIPTRKKYTPGKISAAVGEQRQARRDWEESVGRTGGVDSVLDVERPEEEREGGYTATSACEERESQWEGRT